MARFLSQMQVQQFFPPVHAWVQTGLLLMDRRPMCRKVRLLLKYQHTASSTAVRFVLH